MSFFSCKSRSTCRSFFIYALKHGVSQDPDNRDVEQLGLIRLCGVCSVWRIPIIGTTPMYLLKGMNKKRPTRAPYRVHDLADMKKDILMLYI
jgi:hypothetical protein